MFEQFNIPEYIENIILKQLRLSYKNSDYNEVVNEYKEKLNNMNYCIENHEIDMHMNVIDYKSNNLNYIDFAVLPLIYSEYFFESILSVYNETPKYIIQVCGKNLDTAYCSGCNKTLILTFENRHFTCEC